MTIPLFCFPYGGAGAGVYRPWKKRASAAFRVEPVQYAGREERFAEPFYRTVAEAAEDCANRVEKTVGGGGGFAFFGHSLGALIAYETTRLLMTRCAPLPEHLIVSGAAGPWLPGATLASAR
jgi:surfactin synthase thioesterase subunit